ncbi:MAG: SdpI family protein [Ruminococcus sp.]|nr:SdpI family protein [Ruminococcus sp.]
MLEIITVMNFVISCMLLLGGLLMKGQTDRSSGIGFKTARAMESDEAFALANRTCGRLWLFVGMVSFVLTAALTALMTRLSGKTEQRLQAVLLIIQIIAAVCSVVYTEMKLKKGE